MLEDFVPMRVWLERSTEPALAMAPEPALDEPVAEVEAAPEHDQADDAIDDVRRFRASLADALACCVDELLVDIAGDILGRELHLAPCDVRAIVDRAVARYGIDPVRIRVRPADAPLLETTNAELVADDSLRAGDVVIETHHGTIDASLGVRLERVLARFAQ